MEENQETAKILRIYEAAFLLVPTLAEEKLLQIFSALKEVLANHGATLLGEGFPKPRPLAYPINKLESAFFGWLKFEVDNEALSDLRNFLKSNSEVVRFLLIKTARENTITPPVFFGKIRERIDKKADKKNEEVVEPKMTNEELDKTIEELVVE